MVHRSFELGFGESRRGKRRFSKLRMESGGERGTRSEEMTLSLERHGCAAPVDGFGETSGARQPKHGRAVDVVARDALDR